MNYMYTLITRDPENITSFGIKLIIRPSICNYWEFQKVFTYVINTDKKIGFFKKSILKFYNITLLDFN